MKDYCYDILNSSVSIKFKVRGFVMLPFDLFWELLPVFLNQFYLQLWLCGYVTFPAPQANFKSLYLIGNDLKALKKGCHFILD